MQKAKYIHIIVLACARAALKMRDFGGIYKIKSYGVYDTLLFFVKRAMCCPRNEGFTIILEGIDLKN
jgi:hypothetical protein